MKLYGNSKLAFFITLVLAVALIAFTAIKASVISFTHDESFTYLHYVHESFMDIISYRHAFTNNHILNSVLIKYFEEVFGTSELILRMPNILALGIYLFYSFRIFSVFSKEFVLPFFILISFNPYLIEFFGLARGYGLSFAFMLMSLFHLMAYFQPGPASKNKHLFFFNGAALLAGLSNFTCLNYYMAALITFNLMLFMQEGRSNFFQAKKLLLYNRINLLWILISVLVLWEPIRRVMKKNMLDFGGKTGFIEDTIGSLVNGIAYERVLPIILSTALKLALPIFVLSVFVVITVNVLKKNSSFKENYRHLIIVNFILLIIAASSVLQHLVLNNDFYVGRFALFLYPLLILNLGFLLHLYHKNGLRKSTVFVSFFLALILLVNFAGSVNLTHTYDWRYDMDTKKVMQQMVKEHELHTDNRQKISLGINWLFEPSTNFYRYIRDMNWLYPTNRNGIDGRYDYYYLFNGDSGMQQLKNKNVVMILPQSNTVLLKD